MSISFTTLPFFYFILFWPNGYGIIFSDCKKKVQRLQEWAQWIGPMYVVLEARREGLAYSIVTNGVYVCIMYIMNTKISPFTLPSLEMTVQRIFLEIGWLAANTRWNNFPCLISTAILLLNCALFGFDKYIYMSLIDVMFLFFSYGRIAKYLWHLFIS